MNVNLTSSIKCYEFAKEIDNCGFKENEVEITLGSLSTGEFIESEEINFEWTSETETKFLALNGIFNFPIFDSTDENALDAKVSEEDISTAEGIQGKVQNALNDVGFVLCGVSFALVLAKSFAIMLTKRK